jgi:uncharacterized protein YecE (DUF72 family)
VLKQWAEQIREWERELKAAYLYFDNDQAAYAAANAGKLKRMVGV